MGFLAEIVLEWIAEAIRPKSRKATLRALAVLSAAFALVIAWLICGVPDPLNQPWWGFNAIACAIVYGSVGVIGCGVSLIHGEPEKGACMLLLVTSGALAGLPVAWLVAIS